MPVLINFKICDNAEECNGIDVCPTGALYWDKEKKKIGIDNSKCSNCGKCEKACMVNAISVVKSEEEYNQKKKEIEQDPRNVSDLFVDRYGAQPVISTFIIPDGKFDLEVVKSCKLTAVEFFNDDSIMCLLKSIPIKDLFKEIDVKYRRVEAKDNTLLDKYNVKELPSLLFFKDGKVVGKIEGYYSIMQKNVLMKKIKEITSPSP